MESFKQWLSQYPGYAIGLVAVCIAAFFIFRAAGRSYKRYYQRYRSEEANIKHLLELKEKFADLTENVIKDADDSELLEGVALSYQLKLQKFQNMEEEFAKLSFEQQYVYALDVFTQEKCVKDFFKENGKELTEIILPAFCMIGLEKEAKEAKKLKLMFDESDETTSVNEKTIESVEKFFEENDVLTKVKQCAAKYIKENAEKFV